MQTIKLELTVDQVNVILQALQELPFKISNQLIFEIKKQGDEQLKSENNA